jgi:hypothetical protein
VDSALIDSINTEVRRSSRLADKPEINYKESRRKKTQVEIEESTPETTEEVIEKSGNDDEWDGPTVVGGTEGPDKIGKLLEEADRLFRTIENQDVQFPEMSQGSI